MLYDSDAAKWAAVSRRDATASGHFIYGVKTTRIFCRPNCPARLARRANICFFASSEMASGAGFRACKRCKPDLVASHDPQGKLGRKAVEFIRERFNEISLGESRSGRLDLKGVAKRLGCTTSHFHHVFKNQTGVTPKQFARSLQLQRPSETAGPAVSLAVDEDGENGGFDEWKKWIQSPSWHGIEDEPVGLVEPELRSEVECGIGNDLLSSGEEFIDWDSLLCESVL
jgi:methylphosphotriester-DNA--protein-cysteine methyltransferase